MAAVLVIDDDIKVSRMIAVISQREGYQADEADSAAGGLQKSMAKPYDIVFLDVDLPDGSGLSIINAIRNTSAHPEVVIITGAGDPDGAEVAIRNGAWAYVQKPLSAQDIILQLNRVSQYRETANRPIRRSKVLRRERIVGESPRLMACLEAMGEAAITDANILITGETGTGKELFARAVYENSEYFKSGFVIVDCAALPETLIESTLFGHERGAFTGADHSKEGLIRQADGGTLFLDEAGELSPHIQKSFLRVLQEHRFRPVGAKTELKSNFRVIAATNRNLDQMVTDGGFRKDLLYRLKAVTLRLPPLRERTEDLNILGSHYMRKICAKYHLEQKGFSDDFFDVVYQYPWPGNVREFVNVMETVINAAREEPTIFAKHLPEIIRAQVARASVVIVPEAELSQTPSTGEPAGPAIVSYRVFKNTVLADAEKTYFRNLIKHAKGDINAACEISGLSRSGLYNMMKKHEISRMGWF